MSDATQSVIQRVIAEHRRVVYALVAGVVINVVVFVFLVYPLQSDVANVEQRTRTAEIIAGRGAGGLRSREWDPDRQGSRAQGARHVLQQCPGAGI